jgi:hypothetical protein
MFSINYSPLTTLLLKTGIFDHRSVGEIFVSPLCNLQLENNRV